MNYLPIGNFPDLLSIQDRPENRLGRFPVSLKRISRASNKPTISRQLFARESARITCRCLSVFNYYRRRSHDRNIPAGCHPGREAREEEAKGTPHLSPREYARCRTHTARRILTAFTHYYGTFVIRYGHISHSDAFDLARELRILGTSTARDYFNYLTGGSIFSRTSLTRRRSRNRNRKVLTIL